MPAAHTHWGGKLPQADPDERDDASSTIDDYRRDQAPADGEGAQVITQLKTIEGVRDVTPDIREVEGGWLRLAIQGASSADLRAEVFKLSSQKGWQLRELRRQVGSLEDFFIQMTYKQSISPQGEEVES